MFRENYKKANDSIPVNQELLNSLLKKTDKMPRKNPVPRICAAAAMIGICIFSYAFFHESDQKTNVASVAQNTPAAVTTPSKKAPLKQSEKETKTNVDAEKEQTVLGQESNENHFLDSDFASEPLPATASAVTPRMIELDPDEEYTDAIPQPADKLEVAEEYPQIASAGGGGSGFGGAFVTIGGSAPRGSETEDSALTEDADVETVDGDTQGEESPQPTSTPMLEPALTEENAVSNSQ